MDQTINLIDKVTKDISGLAGIVSIYLYGSILSDNFNYKKSDIDMLILAKDQINPVPFLNKIKTLRQKYKNHRLDLNIVFLSEFKKRWHIYRPPSYFIGIKHRHKLLFGQDLIKTVKDSELTWSNVFKRIVDLSQSSRGISINNKNENFWREKYIPWLRIVVLEILFLNGQFDLSFNSGLKKFKKIYKGTDYLNLLMKKNLPINKINKINEIAENIRVLVLNEINKK